MLILGIMDFSGIYIMPMFIIGIILLIITIIASNNEFEHIEKLIYVWLIFLFICILIYHVA